MERGNSRRAIGAVTGAISAIWTAKAMRGIRDAATFKDKTVYIEMGKDTNTLTPKDLKMIRKYFGAYSAPRYNKTDLARGYYSVSLLEDYTVVYGCDVYSSFVKKKHS